MSGTALIGLDWGTTSARAYRIDARGEVLDVRSAALGIQNVRDGAFDAALATLLGDWQRIDAPRLACGMIGSRQGWLEAPYCETPVSLAALGEGISAVPRANIGIVPGVRTRDAHGMPDVMRGEETQILGAVDPQVREVLAVLPGTHCKWARVEQGHLAAFTTFMTGEVYAALLGHTILGRLAQTPREAALDARSFDAGVARGLASGALLHDIFGARTLALFGELPPGGVADWLSGVLIGAELAAARAWAPDARAVQIIASDALLERYAHACRGARLAILPSPPHAAARGLWRIARATGRLST